MKRRIVASLTAAVLLFAVTACVGLQEAVQKNPGAVIESAFKIGSAAVKASQEITQEQEIYLGRSVSARILKQYPLSRDRRLHKYVNLVGATVAMVSDRPDLEYHFAVLETDEVNAFAAPGGYIFITKGMIDRMATEEELASVLAHEVGHCAAKHGLKSIKSDLWKRVGVITAQETAKHQGLNPELLDLFSKATDKVADVLVKVGYTQQQEFEADVLGQKYSADAGYSPRAMRDYLSLMEKRAHGRDEGLSARLGTHPSFQARLQKLPAEVGTGPPPAAVEVRTTRFRETRS